MNKVKDALWRFLGADAELEWDYDGTVISGTSDTIFVTIETPRCTPNGKWSVSVYPKVCIDAGFGDDFVGTEEDTDIEVCNWFANYDLFIRERLIEILSGYFKELNSTLEDIYERAKDLDLCDLD